MILTTLLAAVAMVPATSGDGPIKCAVMHSPTNEKSVAIEYAGNKYPMCCGGCPAAFSKEPKKFIETAAKSGETIGETMFCPVSGEKLDWSKVKASMDYKGMRYGFCCDSCKGTFEKDPAKYAKAPVKESLVCPGSGETIKAYSEAAGFVDNGGVRYYTCCPDCFEKLRKDTAKVLGEGKAKVTAPVAIAAPKKG